MSFVDKSSSFPEEGLNEDKTCPTCKWYWSEIVKTKFGKIIEETLAPCTTCGWSGVIKK